MSDRSQRESKAITDTPGSTSKRLDFDLIYDLNLWKDMEEYDNKETLEAQKLLMRFDQIIFNEKLTNTRKKKTINPTDDKNKKEENLKVKSKIENQENEKPDEAKVQGPTEDKTQKLEKPKAHCPSSDRTKKPMQHLRKKNTKVDKAPVKSALDTTSEDEKSTSRSLPTTKRNKATEVDKGKNKSTLITRKKKVNIPTATAETKKKIVKKIPKKMITLRKKNSNTNIQLDRKPQQTKAVRFCENNIININLNKPNSSTKLPGDIIINEKSQSPITTVHRGKKISSISASRRSTPPAVAPAKRKSLSSFYSLSLKSTEGHAIDNQAKGFENVNNTTNIIAQKSIKSPEKLTVKINSSNFTTEDQKCCITNTNNVTMENSKG